MQLELFPTGAAYPVPMTDDEYDHEMLERDEQGDDDESY